MKKITLAIAGLMFVSAASFAATVSTVRVNLVPTPAGCSNAGDEVARPVYKYVNGKPVLIGYECAQDNRGGGGGLIN